MTRPSGTPTKSAVLVGFGCRPAPTALDEIARNAAASDNMEDQVLSAQRLAYNGRPQAAIPILDAVASHQPQDTALIVNLSMGYEIAGGNEQALRWLAEALARQPTLGGNTEWLHVKILKAKLASASDPAWFDTHSIAGLDFGLADEPAQAPGAATDADGNYKTHAEARAALETQIPLQHGWVRPFQAARCIAICCSTWAICWRSMNNSGWRSAVYWRAYLCNSALSKLAKRRYDWAHDLNRRQPQPNRLAQAAWLGGIRDRRRWHRLGAVAACAKVPRDRVSAGMIAARPAPV